MPDDDDPKFSDDDKFRPEAIAARIDKIGAETDAERIAHEEELKLLQRKRERKKTGLEAAASKRLTNIGEGSVRRPSESVDAIPEADQLLERATQATKWIREHQSTFAGLVAVSVLGAACALGWVIWQDKRNADASVLLAQAIADDLGNIAGVKDDESDDESATKRLYPTFKSAAERREAALAKYRRVERLYSGTGAATLAQLGEGSLLLDSGDGKGALAAYGAVTTSRLAQADTEVRGRALEGMGFANELLAQTEAPNKDKDLDEALVEFKALEAVDANGYKELGMYHQARVLSNKGDRTKALDVLKRVESRISEPQAGHPYAYLQFVVEDRLREIDPTALPPRAQRMNGTNGVGLGSNVDMNDPKIQEIIRQMQRKERTEGSPSSVPAPGSIP
ncbi:MAG: hypothetical protein ABSF69_21105 [Polyangiaceae bacterium]